MTRTSLMLLLACLFLFSGCADQKKQEEPTSVSPEKKIYSEVNPDAQLPEISVNYWELITDTVKTQQRFTFNENEYELQLLTYSLNDSAIVRTLEMGKNQVYLDHSHTMVTELLLTTDNLEYKRVLDRTDFATFLEEDFYAECNLWATELDSIVGQTAHLMTTLAVPDTDNMWSVWYTLALNKQLTDDLELKEVKYRGM